MHLIPVQAAVDELRELQRRAHNHELEAYQRRICSNLMCDQRRRYLGMCNKRA